LIHMFCKCVSTNIYMGVSVWVRPCHTIVYLVVDLSVAVTISLADHLVSLLVSERRTDVGHELPQLNCVDTDEQQVSWENTYLIRHTKMKYVCFGMKYACCMGYTMAKWGSVLKFDGIKGWNHC